MKEEEMAIKRCKVCYDILDRHAKDGFCYYHAKALTGEEIRAENEWEIVSNRIK